MFVYLKKIACTILFIFVLLHLVAQTNTAFTGITNELINKEVTSILYDKKGFLWFGTRGGLQRFDGYELKQLKHDFGKGENLQSRSIEVLHNGKNNIIWIGTKSGGLSSYNIATGKISNHIHKNEDAREFNGDYILSLLDTDSEKLLIGTWKGFQYYNKKTGKFTIINRVWRTTSIVQDGNNGYWLATNEGLRHVNKNFENDYSLNFGIESLDITSIVIDKQANCMWLGTWQNGIFKLNLSTKQYKNYRFNKENSSSLSSNNAYHLFLDSKRNLWIGTWGGGLNKLNEATNTFEKINLNIPGLYTKDNQIILTIQEDSSGLLWVGTDGSGVFKFDLKQKQFFNIGNNDNASTIIGSTHIIALVVDDYNTLWISTKGGGIQYAKDWKKFNLLATNDHKEGIKVPKVSRAFLADENYLWSATDKGLIRINNLKKGVNGFDVFLPNVNDTNAISDFKTTALAKDANGKIWIGTQENGLNVIVGYNKNKAPIFKKYLPAIGVNGALQNERVSCLFVDSKNRLWIGTYKGLHLYQPLKDAFKVFTQNSNNGLSNNTILCIAEDKFGHIWAGTQYGLNKISVAQDSIVNITSYTTKQGLPSDYVHAIILDKTDNVWASTNKGIVKFNYINNALSIFDKRDGIQSMIFSENAFFKDKTGRFFFGGIEGLTYFHPDSIQVNLFKPPIYFTKLKINNQAYEFVNNGIDSTLLTKPFSQTDTITLSYQKNIFSVEFAALDYHAPDKNEYMYLLDGFSTNWVNAGSERLVSFNNLNPGTYTLKIKATNSDKVWNPTEHKLTITVLPPPWKTWWAYVLYTLIFILLLWLTRHLGLRQEALKSQLMVEKIDREQEKKLAHFKERLFTNISHEFRTPLTLILGPIDDMLVRKKMDVSIAKSLRMVQKQSKRMLRMVNQLLDFQKAEAGNLKLSLQPGEIVSFCYDIFLLFKDEAERRNIAYTFEANEKFLAFAFDQNKLEIIVFNILSNAFKFTSNGQSVHVTIQKNKKQYCEITVEDTGKGIPVNELDKIFDRFYRGKEEDATTISGTGIGLSFVKELTELHGGTIQAFSNGIKGSIFTLTLPPSTINQSAFNISNNALLNANHPIETNLNNNYMQEEFEKETIEQELPIILVVEDDADIQQYIYDILAPSFKVITCSNGKEGLEKAFESIPDLIISDIMMPEMDGIELCEKLKADKGTSHIPIILLTALTDMAHHVQGIQKGADVYLPKPFNSQLLLVHIHNLINLRNTLKQLYAKKVFLGTNNFEIKSFEEEFLFKLMKLVEDNIANTEFNNDELAGLMFMSRSTFYRKLKAVTGMSGNEFIRTSRLNYAAKLLESGNYSVTEAALDAGFNDIKYFRKRFQDQFGVTPSEFKK